MLADSSVVVLALPEIYRELDVSVSEVTWVLVAFNLVLAIAAVPAALAPGESDPPGWRSPACWCSPAASLVCGLAVGIERC